MKFVATEFKNYVFRITLNRPEKRNAFHAEMIKEITESFQKAQSTPNVKWVLLNAEGPSFSAGGDLDWMKSMKNFTFDENMEDSRALFEMFEAGFNIDAPVFGKLHGHVMGGAIGLASICDVVAAEEKTQFCFSEVKWGLVPAVISPFILRKVQKAQADHWMLTAKVFSAVEARDAGLIQFSGSAQQVDQFLEAQTELMAEAAPQAVIETKKLLKKIEGFDPKAVRLMTTKVISERRVSEEGQKGLSFFLNKQKPDWKS